MIRAIALVLAIFLVSSSDATAQAVKNQMVKGTIKKVEVSKDVLIINQKVKNEVVDRELSIEPTTTFIITIDGQKKELAGRQGLELLAGKEGASVQVKCDKDVKVLSVTLTGKK